MDLKVLGGVVWGSMLTTFPDDRVRSEFKRSFVDSVLAERMKSPSLVMEVVASMNGNSFSMANNESTAVSKSLELVMRNLEVLGWSGACNGLEVGSAEASISSLVSSS